jgi:hypothetical protein
MENKEHFTFQTNWMLARLMARNDKHEVYQGGLISDVTYRFFERGYLLSTSMFCSELSQWIPVQLTWIRGLTKNYYKLHFKILFRNFLSLSFTPDENDVLVRQIVDFSMAQKEGIIGAYMEIFNVGKRAQALKIIKGCHEHFRAQITRVKRNRAVIMAHKEVRGTVVILIQ